MTGIWKTIGNLLFKLVALFGIKKTGEQIGRMEERLEAFKDADDKLWDIMSEEEKLRTLEYMEKMEPSDALHFFRNGGVRRHNGKSVKNPPMSGNAGTAAPRKPGPGR